MNSATDDRDSSTTTTSTTTDYLQQPHLHRTGPGQSSVVISPDLRQAIDQLRHVTHADVTGRDRHHKRHDTDRLPLRPVNQQHEQLSHRLSLPLQLPQYSDHLAVRQCSSLTDDVVHVTGTLLHHDVKNHILSTIYCNKNPTFDASFVWVMLNTDE